MIESTFVGRDVEIAALDSLLESVLRSNGAPCFITGEAGTGKTALLTEFITRAQAKGDNIVAAVGDCNDQAGVGTPYLPFREVLNLLTGDTAGESAATSISPENRSRLEGFLRYSGKALVEYGPELIDIFVPGAALAGRVMTKIGGSSKEDSWRDRLKSLVEEEQPRLRTDPTFGELEQNHIFEQYTNVLRAAAEAQPLILVIDDMQWADTGSINLFFHLARRIGKSRILLIGTYRPSETALGRAGARHPLDKVSAELKRYHGDITVALDQSSESRRPFVDALLDREPNRLDNEFRNQFLQHTGGHALFSVELLDTLKERGEIAQDDEGKWFLADEIRWRGVPARVEGILEERIGRLEDELRETLTTASVQGHDFIAEVAANLQNVDARQLVRQLSGDLEKRHHLVEAEGVTRLGRQRVSRYRFRHQVYQRYLYQSLDDIERSYLHEDIAHTLENMFVGHVDDVVVELAWHFTQADLPEQAFPYARDAAIRAVQAYAGDEALLHLNRALETLGEANLPAEDVVKARLLLLQLKESVLNSLGKRSEQSETLDTMAGLANELGIAGEQATAALRRANYHDEDW